MVNIFPHYHQHDAMDCGAACLRMIAKHYGKTYNAETLRRHMTSFRKKVQIDMNYFALSIYFIS